MDTADRDRSGRPAPATAGTLDAGDQAPGTAGDTSGQAAGLPADTASPGPASADTAPGGAAPATPVSDDAMGARQGWLERAAGSFRRRTAGRAWLQRPLARQLSL